MTPADLRAILADAFAAGRPNLSDERSLQLAIRDMLLTARLKFVREIRLNAQSRPDFLIDDALAVEVKVAGSLSALTRQIGRYAYVDRVTGILVVTTRSDHRRLPETINEKPVAVFHLEGL